MKLVTFGLSALLIFFSFCSARAQQPLHKGRPIATWLAELVDDDKQKQIRAEAELRQMGTNALPSMVDYVAATPNPFGGNRNHSIVYNSFMILGAKAKPAIPQLTRLLQVPESRGDAVNALICIGDETMPFLIKLLDNKDPQVRLSALQILRATLRPDSDTKSIPAKAELALPSIRKRISDKNPEVALSAMSAFSSICTNADWVVKEITPNLEAENVQLRSFVAVELRAYSKHASPAIPALIKALNDTNEMVRSQVALTLHTIDPHEARKAGAKVPLYE